MATNPSGRLKPVYHSSLDPVADVMPALKPKNPLDAEEHLNALRVVQSMDAEGIDLHADNRAEQLLDCDYYDHDQIDQETRETYAMRNQAPLVYNLIHPVIDWLVGTERRTRVDWKVHPRNEEDVEVAEVKTKTLKFIADTNGSGFARSKAFKDATLAGVGWTREYAQVDDKDGPPVGNCHIDWKLMRWDAYSRADDLSDCRYVTCDRYLDLDYAIALWPAREDELRGAANTLLEPGLEMIEDDIATPQVFWGASNSVRRGSAGIGTMATKSSRMRVRIRETEYRRPVVEKRLRLLSEHNPELRNALYDPEAEDQIDAINKGRVAVDDRIGDRIWLMVWIPGVVLVHEPMGYKHKKYSFTPTWCYRRHRDGMPYGIVRGLRDPQDEYNKRRSKAVFALSANQVIHEEDAISEDMRDDFLEQVNKPNGVMRVANGALSGKKVEFRDNAEMSAGQLQMTQDARQHITEASGVTRENLGIESGAISGKAILAKQQQGAVTTAEVFDNYRFAIQQAGEKTLSLCEQFFTKQEQVRILGENGYEWITVNEPRVDPITGNVVFDNDLTATAASFVVDQQDFRETARMALAETLMETIARMPPEVGIQLLDLAVDLMDIPNKQEFVARIRKINGVAAENAPQTPEQQQEAMEQAAMAKRAQEAGLSEQEAKAENLRASAKKSLADARNKDINTKDKALETAANLAAVIDLAPAADRLAPFPDENVQPAQPIPLTRPGVPNAI